MSTDGQGTKWRRKIAENFNRLSRRTNVTDDRQTDDRRQRDGRAIAHSKCSTMSLINPFISGSKGQRSRSRVYARHQTKSNIAVCCVRKLRWIFPAAQTIATPGFPCVASTRPMILPTAGFSARGVFRSQPSAKHCRRQSRRPCEYEFFSLVVLFLSFCCRSTFVVGAGSVVTRWRHHVTWDTTWRRTPQIRVCSADIGRHKRHGPPLRVWSRHYRSANRPSSLMAYSACTRRSGFLKFDI